MVVVVVLVIAVVVILFWLSGWVCLGWGWGCLRSITYKAPWSADGGDTLRFYHGGGKMIMTPHSTGRQLDLCHFGLSNPMHSRL